jgi:hypothetical protein
VEAMDGSSYSSVMVIFDQLWRVVLLAVIVLGLLLGFLAGSRYVLEPNQSHESEYVQFVTHCEGCGSEFWNRINRIDIPKHPKTFKSCPNCPLTQKEFEALKKQALEKISDSDARAFSHQLRPAWRIEESKKQSSEN